MGLGCGCSNFQAAAGREEHAFWPSVPTWPRQSSSSSDQTFESSLGQVRSSLVRYVTRTLRGRRDAAYRVQIKLPSDRSTAACASAAVPPRMRASTSRGAVLRNTLPCDCPRPVPASVATPSGIADGIGRGTRSTRTLALSGYSVSLVSRGGPTGTLRRACARRTRETSSGDCRRGGARRGSTPCKRVRPSVSHRMMASAGDSGAMKTTHRTMCNPCH